MRVREYFETAIEKGNEKDCTVLTKFILALTQLPNFFYYNPFFSL